MMALAVDAIQKGNLRSLRGALATTIFFGCIFLGCQVYEFSHFVSEKHMTITNSMLGTTFFTLTGTHGMHVLVGVIWLTSMLVYSYTGRLTQKDAMDVEMMGLYWHFVDIVWIVIFTAVYLLEYVT
jgi:heme/copper-type cytochrome/quinol oxidase subunit 3